MNPEYLRTLDPRGRLALPAPVAAYLGSHARFQRAAAGYLLALPAAAGVPVRPVGRDTTAVRLCLPKDLRGLAGLHPGTRAALALTRQGLAIWPGEGAGEPVAASERLAGALAALLQAGPFYGDRWDVDALPAERLLALAHRAVNALYTRGKERTCWAEVEAVEREIEVLVRYDAGRGG